MKKTTGEKLSPILSFLFYIALHHKSAKLSIGMLQYDDDNDTIEENREMILMALGERTVT